MLTLLLLLSPGILPAQDTVRITLPEAVDLAAARNVDLLRAENALRSAQTRIESAQGAFQPNLTISANPGVRYQLGSQSGQNADNATGTFSLGASSGYTLYEGGANRATLAQAEQLARASDIGINRTSQTTVNAVITSFYQIATQRELIAVAQENLDAERRQIDRVQAFTDAGTRPISDLYTEQANLASAELNLLQAQRNFEVAKLALVQILRLDPLRAYDFPTPASPPAYSDDLTGNVPVVAQRALSTRPEVAAQQARIEAAKQGIRIAEAGKSPTVSLSGSVGSSYSTTNDVDGFGSQLFTQNPSASVGLSFSLPVFDRNRTDAAEAAAQIDYENEVLAMTDLRQQISVEVQQARLELNTAQAQLQAADRQLSAARQALDVEQARYENGVSTLTELTQARARYVSAEGQVVQARNNLELSRQALAYAVGTTQAPRVTPQQPTEQ
jgi:outer membrane protein